MPDEMESAQNPTDPAGAQSEPRTPEQPEPSVSSDDEADALAEAALASAQAAIDALNAGDEEPTPSAHVPPADSHKSQPKPSPLSIPDFSKVDLESLPKGMDLLSDVNVDVTIELGRTRMLVEDVLRLGEGAVVELDKLAGDPVDIYVNKRLVARGEVLVLNDNFCIRVNDILDADLVEQERG